MDKNSLNEPLSVQDLIARLDAAAAESQEEASTASTEPTVVTIIGETGHGKRTVFASIEATLKYKGLLSMPCEAAKADGGEIAGEHDAETACAVADQTPPFGPLQELSFPLGDQIYRIVCGGTSMTEAPHTVAALSQSDIAIVVVSAADYQIPSEENSDKNARRSSNVLADLLDTAKRMGVKRIVVYLNKCDLVEDDTVIEALEGHVTQLTAVAMLPSPIIVEGCARGVIEDFAAAEALPESPVKQAELRELADEETSITGLLESVNYAAFALASSAAVDKTRELKDKFADMLGDGDEEQDAVNALDQLLNQLGALNGQSPKA